MLIFVVFMCSNRHSTNNMGGARKASTLYGGGGTGSGVYKDRLKQRRMTLTSKTQSSII